MVARRINRRIKSNRCSDGHELRNLRCNQKTRIRLRKLLLLADQICGQLIIRMFAPSTPNLSDIVPRLHGYISVQLDSSDWQHHSGCLCQGGFRLEMNGFDFEPPHTIRDNPAELIADATAEHRRS